MKGLVFREFEAMVEGAFGPDMFDDLVDDCDLDSGGAYTTVGDYDHAEMLALVTALSKRTGTPVPDLVVAYGQFLIPAFRERYQPFFDAHPDLFEFLESIETQVHVEVLKLYPTAQLPKFDTQRLDERTLLMTYTSPRPFAGLAHGLILGAIGHYGVKASVDVDDQSQPGASLAYFTIKLED